MHGEPVQHAGDAAVVAHEVQLQETLVDVDFVPAPIHVARALGRRVLLIARRAAVDIGVEQLADRHADARALRMCFEIRVRAADRLHGAADDGIEIVVVEIVGAEGQCFHPDRDVVQRRRQYRGLVR
jgi:hypothetical protein